MRNRLYRLLLITEFLIAVQVMFTLWSQVGGQSHLDLMFWPWKFGLSLLAAGLTVAITAGRQPRLAIAMLLLTVITAGVVTYYYHVNEPTEQDTYEDTPAGIQKSSSSAGPLWRSYQTRQAFAPLTIG